VRELFFEFLIYCFVMGGDQEDDYMILPPPPLDDRLWRHPAEIGQLKRINRSMIYFRLFGKISIAVGVYLLWGKELFDFVF
tara:strand:+ start:1951 stop:2193 length:243 start_codon:yes stop_codon:yes gene_type:complete